jgi:hypothetical protein
MGLLDDTPDGLFELIRNAPQRRNLNAYPGTYGASDSPWWTEMQQRRAR